MTVERTREELGGDVEMRAEGVETWRGERRLHGARAVMRALRRRVSREKTKRVLAKANLLGRGDAAGRLDGRLAVKHVTIPSVQRAELVEVRGVHLHARLAAREPRFLGGRSFGGVAAEVALVDPSIGFVDVEVRELDGFARARGGLVRHLRERFRGGAGEFHRRALRLELGGARGDEFSAQLAASAREVRVGHDGVRGRGGGVSVVGVARGARGAAGEEPGFVVVPPSAAEDVAARRFETCREGGDGAMSRRLERGGGGGDGAARGGARGAANLGGAERRAVLLAGHPAGGHRRVGVGVGVGGGSVRVGGGALRRLARALRLGSLGGEVATAGLCLAHLGEERLHVHRACRGRVGTRPRAASCVGGRGAVRDRRLSAPRKAPPAEKHTGRV